jgi:succinoglycan biosynthesis protein ExoA
MTSAAPTEASAPGHLLTGDRPRVSVIVPARNEEEHIGACVRSILRQQVDGGLEVIVADGRSPDRTADVARAAGATVVRNPLATTPAGLNAALERSRGEVVVRFDAHAEMPPGYVAACVRALDEQPGPVCVGGWRRVEAQGPWGRATAAALASRFGVGNPRLWSSPCRAQQPLDVDTVALGCWSAGHLRAIGGWSERYLRNQDFELNYRLRNAGGRVVFDPTIWSVYRPRESFREIVRQYWDYGRFKALLLTEKPGSLRPRQLAPVGLIAALATAAVPGAPRKTALTAVGAYVTGLAAVSARSRAGWRTAAVLATMHLTWGSGLVLELGRLGARRMRPVARADDGDRR